MSSNHKDMMYWFPGSGSSPTMTVKPFQLTCCPFPIKHAFALPISKTQGKTLEYMALCLPRPVFSHAIGQIYVALSWVGSKDRITIMVVGGHSLDLPGVFTKNVSKRSVVTGSDHDGNVPCHDASLCMSTFQYTHWISYAIRLATWYCILNINELTLILVTLSVSQCVNFGNWYYLWCTKKCVECCTMQVYIFINIWLHSLIITCLWLDTWYCILGTCYTWEFDTWYHNFVELFRMFHYIPFCSAILTIETSVEWWFPGSGSFFAFRVYCVVRCCSAAVIRHDLTFYAFRAPSLTPPLVYTYPP